MISFPNAKVNLGLKVTGKRPDGYHNIETVFLPVSLCDILEVIPNGDGQAAFFTSGLEIPGVAEENLCLKAWRLFHDTYPEKFGFVPSILLHKIIPPGSGLGGGSSDAASALKLLNSLCSASVDDGELEKMAGNLGSDCPFFIRNVPVFAEGRGDLFSPVRINLAGYNMVLVLPPVHVSTAEAYGMVTPGPSAVSIREIVERPVRQWKDNLVNDFEKPVADRYPVIAEIRDLLYSGGAAYASMSGSGSAVFGIFEGGHPSDLHFPENCKGFSFAL